MAVYDATPPVFLPVISVFLSALLLAAPARGLPQLAVPAAMAQDPRQSQLARVVGGSGSPSAEAVATVQGVVAEQLPQLERVFGKKTAKPFFVFVHGDRAQLPTELAKHQHEDSPGFALLGRHQVHLVWGEMRRTGSSLRGVVVHELVHELLDQFADPHGGRLPRWFHEGLAQHLAGDTYLGAREEDLVWRVAAGRLLSFGDLRTSFPDGRQEIQAAYAQSYSYVSWLVRTFGMKAMLSVASSADDLTSFERALAGRTGRTTLQLEEAWRNHLMHGSGAPWRVLLDQCFSLLVIVALPVLALAVIRRLAAERRAAERLARSEQLEQSEQSQQLAPPPPDDGSSPDERTT